jgi:hypothetical protein
MAVIIGTTALFGIQGKKPLRGFPEGRVKIVIRPSDFVTAFVKTKSGIRKFYVKEVDGFYEPCLEAMANYKETVTA